MDYTIDSDVPPPASRRGKGYKEAVLRLSPGQSVWLPTTYASGRALVASAYLLNERERGEFKVRPDGDGIRVWRLADDI